MDRLKLPPETVTTIIFYPIGISGDKIEIDPMTRKSKIFKQNALTYDIENIAACTVMDERSNGKQGKTTSDHYFFKQIY